MKDLIYRQDAIDALFSEGRNVDSRYFLAERIIHESDAIEAISMLPSAQQWTPVTEGLPDKDVPVLVYLFGDSPYIAWINRDGEWETEEFIIDCDYLPKAWMPLPEPYEEKRDE